MNSARPGCLRALALLFAAVVLLFAAAYVFRDKFIAKAKARLDLKLAEEQFFVDYTVGADARLNAVTLRNLTFYRSSDRKEPAATLDHLSLRIPLVDSLRAGAVELIASAQNARFEILAPEDPVVWEDLTFRYHHRASSRSLDRFHTLTRGLSLNLAARWDVPPEEEPAAPSTPAPSGPTPPSSSSTPAPSPSPESLPPAPATVVPSKLDLSPLLALAEALDYRQAGFQPKLALQADGKRSPDGAMAWTVTGNTTSFPSRGADLRLDGAWTRTPEGNLTLTGLTLTQADRQAQIAGTLRQETQVFEISQFESSLDWISLLRDVPALAGSLAGLETVAPAQLSVRGNHHLGHPDQSDLSFAVSGWGLNRHQENGRPPLEIRDLQLKGTLQAGAVDIPSFQAAVAGGAVKGQAHVLPFAEKLAWKTSFDAQNLALARLVKPSERFPAQGSVQLSFSGNGSSGPETLQGQGKLEISQGRFLDVTLLGSLLRFLERMAPGLGAGVSDQVSGTFALKDGVLRSEDLLLQVSASQVAVRGQVDLTSRQTQLEARANLRGLLSAITETLTEGQGLVIEGTGPVDKIDWKLKNLGKGGVLSEILSKSPASGTANPNPATSAAPASPAAPAGSIKEQIKQQAMDSLLNGNAEEAVGNLLQGIKERRALRRQPVEGTPAPQN